MKVHAEVYGCSSNLADFEIALGLLKKEGFEICEEDAELNLIFTCVVKLPTFNKMLHRIKELTKSEKPLIVSGCMAKSDLALIEKINPKASVVSSENLKKITEVAKEALKGKRVLLVSESNEMKLNLPRCRKNPVVGIIQIANGCLSNCSYCYEPYRGKLLSYPEGEIVKEVERALREGCKEIWLSSLDNGCYGFDRKSNLAKLLEKICELEGKFFVRVGMMNPMHVKVIVEELIKAFEDERIFKFLHLPLQSGSDRILELMGRRYSSKEFLEIVEKFRKAFPCLTLSTDVIVGFPSETEEDFEETLKIVKRVKPSILNISKFGAMPRTRAAEMEQVEASEKKERVRKLIEIFNKISLKNNQKWVGWKGEILVDEKGKNSSLVGRNFAYKPIVLKTEENLVGNFVEVEVSSASKNCLFGKLK